MIVTIESKTKPETEHKSIKYNGEWHKLSDVAIKFFDDINRGDSVEISEKNGVVIYIKKIKQHKEFFAENDMNDFEAPKEEEDKEAARMLNLELIATQQQTIIQQNANINKMLFKLLKHFNLFDGPIKIDKKDFEDEK